MPRFKLTNRKTGAIVYYDGDKAPSRAEADALFAEQKVQNIEAMKQTPTYRGKSLDVSPFQEFAASKPGQILSGVIESVDPLANIAKVYRGAHELVTGKKPAPPTALVSPEVTPGYFEEEARTPKYPRVAGAADVAGGVLGLASLGAPAALRAAPAATAAGIGGGLATSEATRRGMESMGFEPEVAELTGLGTGAVAGGALAKRFAPRATAPSPEPRAAARTLNITPEEAEFVDMPRTQIPPPEPRPIYPPEGVEGPSTPEAVPGRTPQLLRAPTPEVESFTPAAVEGAPLPELPPPTPTPQGVFSRFPVPQVPRTSEGAIPTPGGQTLLPPAERTFYMPPPEESGNLPAMRGSREIAPVGETPEQTMEQARGRLGPELTEDVQPFGEEGEYEPIRPEELPAPAKQPPAAPKVETPPPETTPSRKAKVVEMPPPEIEPIGGEEATMGEVVSPHRAALEQNYRQLIRSGDPEDLDAAMGLARAVGKSRGRVKKDLDSAGVKGYQSLLDEYFPKGKALVKKLAEEESGQLNLGKMKSEVIEPAKEVIKRGLSGVKEQLAAFSPELSKRVMRSLDEGEVMGNRRIEDYLRGIDKIDVNRRLNITDVLEGKARPVDPEVAAAATKAQDLLQRDIPAEATQVNFQGFQPRQNYFPHHIPPIEQLKSGPIRENMIKYFSRTVPDYEAKLDSWISSIESGKWHNDIVDLVAQNNRVSKAEALSLLQRFMKPKVRRYGSLDYEREFDVPFWDPDPANVLPNHAMRASQRLSHVRNLGQDNEIANQLIYDVSQNDPKANVDRLRKLYERATGVYEPAEHDINLEKASSLARTLQGFQLNPLSSVANLTQQQNILLASDVPSFMYGLKSVFTEAGRKLARRSGAAENEFTHDQLHEITEITGGPLTGALDKYLKFVGMSGTEYVNRVAAANAGAHYASRLVIDAQTGNRAAIRALENLGVSQQSIQAGRLTQADVHMAAKKFSDLVNFRSRTVDRPLWTSTPLGRVVWQFKQFTYSQGKLMWDQTMGELQSGNYGRGVRNLLLVATLFPATGAVVNEIQDLARGKKPKETSALKTWWEGVMQSSVLGYAGEVFKSGEYGRLVEGLAGPTAGLAGDVGRAAFAKDKGKAVESLARRRLTTGTGRIFLAKPPAPAPMLDRADRNAMRF